MAYQVANNNLAVSLCGWAGWCFHGALCATGRLGDTSNWGSWGVWLAAGASAWSSATTASARAWGVGHDLVKGLINLGRHSG